MTYVNKTLENMLNINQQFGGGGVWARDWININKTFTQIFFITQREELFNIVYGIIIEVKYLISFNSFKRILFDHISCNVGVRKSLYKKFLG